MKTLTIQISDRDSALFEQLARRLNAKIIKTEDVAEKRPNQATLQAIRDARTGKTKQITDLDAFFDSL